MSYWKDLAARIKENKDVIKKYGKDMMGLLGVALFFAFEFLVLLFLLNFLGFLLGLIIVVVEVILIGDYQNFRERQKR